MVSAHMSDLLTELANFKAAGGLASLPKEENDGLHSEVLADRFIPHHSSLFTRESVVLLALDKPKGGSELQLNSMTALTSKTSSQRLFPRVLTVIVQLREAALLAIKKAKKEALPLMHQVMIAQPLLQVNIPLS